MSQKTPQRIDLAGSGGRTRKITRALLVSTSSGALATLPIGRLASPVTCAKTSGSSDLSVASSTGVISSAAGIAASASEQILGTMTGADGCVITYDYTLTGEDADDGGDGGDGTSPWLGRPTLRDAPTAAWHYADPSTHVRGVYDQVLPGVMVPADASNPDRFYLNGAAPAGFSLGQLIYPSSFNNLQDAIRIMDVISGTPGASGSVYSLSNGTGIGTVGPPAVNANFRVWDTDLVLGIQDYTGNGWDLTSQLVYQGQSPLDVAYGGAPLAIVTEEGLPMVHFGAIGNDGGAFMECRTKTGVTLDTHNHVYCEVSETLDYRNDTQWSLGVRQYTGNTTSTAPGARSHMASPGTRPLTPMPAMDCLDQAIVHGGVTDGAWLVPPVNLSFLMTASWTTATGFGVTGGQCFQQMTVRKKFYTTPSSSNIARTFGPGLGVTTGLRPAFTNLSAAGYTHRNVVWAAMWALDELAGGATGSARQTNILAALQRIRDDINAFDPNVMVDFTDNWIEMGDSRKTLNNGSGFTPAVYMTRMIDPATGQKVIKNTTRVIGLVHGGWDNADGASFTQLPGGYFASRFLFGGGHDYCSPMWGPNDTGSSYPINEPTMRSAAAHTAQAGDEAYDTTIFDGAGTCNIAASKFNLETLTSGKVYARSRLIVTGIQSGIVLGSQTTGAGTTPGTAGVWTATQGVTARPSGTAFVTEFPNVLRTYKEVLTAGIKLAITNEMASADSPPWDAARAQLRTRIAGAIADLTAWNATLAANAFYSDMSTIVDPWNGGTQLGVDAYATFQAGLLFYFNNDHLHELRPGARLMGLHQGRFAASLGL